MARKDPAKPLALFNYADGGLERGPGDTEALLQGGGTAPAKAGQSRAGEFSHPPGRSAYQLGGTCHRPFQGGDVGSEGDGQGAHAPGVESTCGESVLGVKAVEKAHERTEGRGKGGWRVLHGLLKRAGWQLDVLVGRMDPKATTMGSLGIGLGFPEKWLTGRRQAHRRAGGGSACRRFRQGRWLSRFPARLGWR